MLEMGSDLLHVRWVEAKCTVCGLVDMYLWVKLYKRSTTQTPWVYIRAHAKPAEPTAARLSDPPGRRK